MTPENNHYHSNQVIQVLSWKIVSEFLRCFPGKFKTIETHPDDIFGNAAYRFWFLLKEDKPVVALETPGTLWTADGNQFELMKIYQHDRRIWNLIDKTIGYLLP